MLTPHPWKSRTLATLARVVLPGARRLTVCLAAMLALGNEASATLSYTYAKWWTQAMEDSVRSGDYSTMLAQFDFQHPSLPAGTDFSGKAENFFVGNGLLGMFIDPFGAQTVPFTSAGQNGDRDAIDATIGTMKSAELVAGTYTFYRNSMPVINSNDNWSTMEAEFNNSRGRGAFSMRASVFPIIDGQFDPTKITNYNQKVDLWNCLCITRFDYNAKARITMTSFASWSSVRLAVFSIRIDNLTQANIAVGAVAEPIVSFGGRQTFTAAGDQLTLDKTDANLLFRTAVCMGYGQTGGAPTVSGGKIKATQTLAAGGAYAFTAYLSMDNAHNSATPLASVQSNVSAAVSAGLDAVTQAHEATVHAFWKRWFILLPWQDLCKVYYRNALIVASNLRGGDYYPAISMLANSSYDGGGWGMDNVPSYDLMMQTGHATDCKNVLSRFADVLPNDAGNVGSQLDYSFDDNPLASNIVCSSSGNYAWLLYEYYKFTGDAAFLSSKAYPLMRSVSNFWSGYANKAGGSYGIWTQQSYGGQTWSCHTYDEWLNIPGMGYAEADNITDVVAPAKCMMTIASQTAKALTTDAALVTRWNRCNDSLIIPQNADYYLGYKGRDYSDAFPNRFVTACGLFNTIYPTVCDGIDKVKLENTLLKCNELTDTYFFWSFNYNQQLWSAAARLRLSDALQFLMTQSELSLSRSIGYDDMTIFEHNDGTGAGHFLMPYPMIDVSINDMLMQSFDGVIRVFPCVIPALSTLPGSFAGLSAFGGFTVSAQRDQGGVTRIDVTATQGGACTVEVPREWQNANVTNATGQQVSAAVSTQTVRISKADVSVKVLSFSTTQGGTYTIAAGGSPVSGSSLQSRSRRAEAVIARVGNAAVVTVTSNTPYEVTLHSLDGRLIRQFKGTRTGTIHIDAKAVAPGIYSVSVAFANQRSWRIIAFGK